MDAIKVNAKNLDVVFFIFILFSNIFGVGKSFPVDFAAPFLCISHTLYLHPKMKYSHIIPKSDAVVNNE